MTLKTPAGLFALAAVMFSGVAFADSTIVVTPSSLSGWTLNTFDNTGAIANTGGTAALVAGPGTPPLGIGSAQLATPVGGGDGAAAIATEGYDGMLLSSITKLSYSTYDVTNNGQQFPYLAISINTGVPANPTDTLFFEPPYQQPATGNPLLPDQGATQMNTWQTWNALEGGFWDNNGIGNPGVGAPGVVSLATIEAAYPNATIANGGFPGLGGIAMQVGFASPGDTYNGYVDNFTIGVNGSNTIYDFEPAGAGPQAVPEPSRVIGLLSIFGMGLVGLVWNRRRQAT
jgi:hypothetical protein